MKKKGILAVIGVALAGIAALIVHLRNRRK